MVQWQISRARPARHDYSVLRGKVWIKSKRVFLSSNPDDLGTKYACDVVRVKH